MRTTRGEDEESGDGEEEDEAWEGWEIGSESSDDSSDSGGWIDIESDGEDHLNVSDSDAEDGKNGDKLRKDDGSPGDVNRTSTLATTKVCGRAILDEPFDRSDAPPRP